LQENNQRMFGSSVNKTSHSLFFQPELWFGKCKNTSKCYKNSRLVQWLKELILSDKFLTTFYSYIKMLLKCIDCNFLNLRFNWKLLISFLLSI